MNVVAIAQENLHKGPKEVEKILNELTNLLSIDYYQGLGLIQISTLNSAYGITDEQKEVPLKYLCLFMPMYDFIIGNICVDSGKDQNTIRELSPMEIIQNLYKDKEGPKEG